MTATAIKFTNLEREILAHRLAVPGCIAEALDGDPCEVEFTCRLISAAIDAGHFGSDEIETPKQLDAANPFLVREILADCVEGSTFLAASKSGDESKQKLNAIYRAGQSLAVKIGEYVGRELEYPGC